MDKLVLCFKLQVLVQNNRVFTCGQSYKQTAH